MKSPPPPKTRNPDVSPRGAREARWVLFSSLAKALHSRGITFAVINGYNEKTKELGRDIDVLARRGDLATIIRACEEVARELDWPYVSGRWVEDWLPRGLYQAAFHKVLDQRVINLALDFIFSDGLAAGFVPVYSPGMLEHGVRYAEAIPVHEVATYAKKVLQVLAGLEKSIAWIERRGDLPDKVGAHLDGLLGSPYRLELEKSIRERSLRSDWPRLRRRAQQLYSRKHPLKAFVNGILSFLRKYVGPRVHHVTAIGIVGFDRVGKRAAIAEAMRFLEGSFITIKLDHQRPRPLSDPDKLQAVHSWLDYAIGCWWTGRYYSSSDFLVNLYDYPYTSASTAPARLERSPRTVPLHPAKLLPKLDLLFLLYDTPEPVVRRSAELTPAEIVQASSSVRRINIANETPSAVGQEIGLHLLELVSRLR